MADGQEAQKYPLHAVGTLPPDVPIEEKPEKWWIRAGIWIGALMSTTTPKVWGFNPSVITLLILIGGLLTGAGYYIGDQAATIRGIQKTADEAKAAAVIAKDLALEGQAVDETPTPTPLPKRR